MSKFCELRLVNFVTHTKTCSKQKQVTSTEHELVENKPKRNRKEKGFSNKASNLNMPSIAENIKIKSKSEVASRTAKRNTTISHHQSNTAVKQSTNSSSLKLNTPIEACESDEKIKLLQPKLGCQVIKKKVSVGAEKNMSLPKKTKTNLNIDTKHISSNLENICKMKKGRKNKKNTKRRTHQFWESNLTGARRVSKRLTNLKFKNKNAISLGKISEKYIVPNISLRISNQGNQSSAQRSVFMNVSQNNLKLSKKTTVSKALSARNQLKASSKYCRVDRKNQPYAKMESNKEFLVKKVINVADTDLPKVSNDFYDTEKTLKSNPSSLCRREIDKLSMSSSSAVFRSGIEEEVSTSSVDQEEGVNDFGHLDLKMKETPDLYQNIEDNSVFSANKTACDLNSSTEAVILDSVQSKECKEDTEIIIKIIDMKTEETTSSFIPGKPGNITISSKCSEEKYQEKKEITEPTKVLKLSSLVPGETQINNLKFNTTSFSENSEVVGNIDNHTSKEEMDIVTVNDVFVVENKKKLEENVQLD